MTAGILRHPENERATNIKWLAAPVDKVTDYAEIARFGVVSTSGIVVDGKVVHAGGLPKPEAIGGWLTE